MSIIQAFAHPSSTEATPATRIIYLAWGIYGAVMLFASFTPPWEPSLALAHLPFPFDLVMGAMMLLGGAGSLTGSLPGWRVLSRAWLCERIGLGLSIAVWSCYAITAWWFAHWAFFSWGAAVVHVAFAVVRIQTLGGREKETRQNVSALKALRTEMQDGTD